MNENDFLDGISNIENDVVERFISMDTKLKNKARSKSVWIRLGALAACLAVLLSAIIYPKLFNTSIPIIPSSSSAPTAAPKYYGSESCIGSGSSISHEHVTTGISVTASLIETLPDTYTFYDDWRQYEYRVLHMKTEKLIVGAEMTDEFYYLVPIEYMTDFSIYHSFVIKDMAQIGYEYSVMYNKTQGKAEQLPLVLFGYKYYHVMGIDFMAFNILGVFDNRLWNSNQSWKYDTKDEDPPLTVKIAESNITEKINADWTKTLYVHKLDDVTGEAAEVLADIRSFENGIYVPLFSSGKLYLHPEVQFHATRYINGFATNEKVSIWGKEWTSKNIDIYEFSKARFTKEDMDKLPDLASAFEAVKVALTDGMITPPHFENDEKLRKTTSSVFGWYAKTEKSVVGIIRVNWQFYSENHKFYYDDSYYIIEYGSDKCKEIDRDTLLKKLGEYETTYIFDGKYDKNGKIFDEVIICA